MGTKHSKKKSKSINKQNALETHDEKTQKMLDKDDGNNGYIVSKYRLEPIARILLMGVYDDNNILSNLRGTRFILKRIWELAISFNATYWKQYLSMDQIYIGTKQWEMKHQFDYFAFPKPTNTNINMMPFIMSDNFEQSKLPSKLEPYWKVIQRCLLDDRSQRDMIGYLTIDESVVSAGRTQRRPGLHVEVPGPNSFNGAGHSDVEYVHPRVGQSGLWGGGSWENRYNDGIYMCSNVYGSCAMWECNIVADKDTKRDIVGHLGNIEHLRRYLPEDRKQIMRGNTIYWITDRTPHESLPVEKTTYRQFFRLVTHRISVWYEQHSTANPNGVVPPKYVHIVKGNKFKKN